MMAMCGSSLTQLEVGGYSVPEFRGHLLGGGQVVGDEDVRREAHHVLFSTPRGHGQQRVEAVDTVAQEVTCNQHR